MKDSECPLTTERIVTTQCKGGTTLVNTKQTVLYWLAPV